MLNSLASQLIDMEPKEFDKFRKLHNRYEIYNSVWAVLNERYVEREKKEKLVNQIILFDRLGMMSWYHFLISSNFQFAQMSSKEIIASAAIRHLYGFRLKDRLERLVSITDRGLLFERHETSDIVAWINKGLDIYGGTYIIRLSNLIICNLLRLSVCHSDLLKELMKKIVTLKDMETETRRLTEKVYREHFNRSIYD